MQRSWLIPGGGFFYTGHAALGILHGVVEAVLLLVVAYWLLVALKVVPQESGTGEAAMDMASALVVVAVFAVILAINKWVMASVARRQVRNYIPLG